MRNLFASLQLWKKFALLGVIGIVLFGVPTALYISSAEGIIAHKQLEIKGVNPARALLRTMQLMQQHRGMSAVLIGGNAGVAPQRQAKAQEVDKAWQVLFDELRKNGVRDPAIEKGLTAVQTAWNGLRDGVAGGQVTGPQSFNTHSDQIARLFEINDLILDDFKLSLDADLDSSKLITGAFVAFPLLTEELGKMRARGSAMLAKKAVTPDDKLAIIRPSQRGQERLRQADKLFQQAFLINASLRDSLGGTVDNARKLALGAIALADEKVLKPEALEFPPQEYFARFTEAIDAQFKVVDVVIGSLESTLGQQTAQMRRNEIWVLGCISALALFAAWIGTMLSRSITVPMSESVSMAQRVASCDLTSRAVVVGSDESAQLLHALNDMTGSLVHIVGDVRTSIDVIHVASKEIAMGNADLSNRTESQASSLEQTASSMEELTSTVRQNADNARQANSLVTTASELAVKGGEVVGNVVHTMGSIKESSSKIVDIISVIDGIAFQTNILALNAAVEAARAGEQGRGFAVVASEVRSLAQRSASAAKEIKELISDSVGKVDAGGKLVDEAGATMGEIVTSVKHVADIMSEITAASQEQSVGIEEVNRAITHMDEITQQNAALVEQAAAAAESLQEQADILAQTVSVFKITPAERHAATPGMPLPPVQAARRLSVVGKPATQKKAAAPALKVLSKPAAKTTVKPAESAGNANDWEEF
ncbi:methyl-accepting chemotaxis protein [Herbaspirillum rhizosphaerae]|uniref:methyl-accepting chemotaxis protein n=1 Tax=Herbaspirillum rhizosphaerae TaxID=346179 RepID=UPI0009F8B4E3|nr:methyl-accepting chemotaxis protein [Herbaspirillum rhizosphaerae]